MKLMRIRAVRGPGSGVEAVVNPGQSLTIGRSDTAGVSIPQDALISSFHLQIESLDDGGFQLTDLGSMNGTFVNGGRVDKTRLLDGDTVRVGKTEFTVVLAEAPQTYAAVPVMAKSSGTASVALHPVRVESGTSPGPPASRTRSPERSASCVAGTADEVMSRFSKVEILAPLKAEITEGQTPVELARLLLSQNRASEALGFLAHALEKRFGVWWGCQVIRDLHIDMSDVEVSQLRLAELWVRESEERQRREAMASAEASEFATATAWMCVAAFWSGDNIAPPGASAAIQPGDDLTGKALLAALLMAVAKVPEETPQRNQRAVEIGIEIANGRRGWPA